MGDIDRIVQVTISRQTVVPSMASFNDVLIAAEFLASSVIPPMSASERIREYGSIAEVAAAGFSTSSFVYRAASKIFSQNPRISRVFVGRKKTGVDGTETWDVALAAMAIENPNWYGLVVETRTEADQQVVATWVETQTRLCILASADADIVDAASGDIADYLKTNNIERTAVIYHPDAGDVTEEPCPDAAWFGKMFSKDPGSATWAFKTLTGVSTYALTTAQVNRAKGKNANIYTSVSDVAITEAGTVGSGEFLDVMHGIDWLTARIQQRVFTVLVQQDKIPYTDAGVQSVVGELKAALQEAVDINLIASYEVDYPLVADVAPASKAARILPDVTFTAILSGAVHKVEIAGVVTL
jgi:hypothetical protein